ncbi:MAG: zf-HC2 domain-containing protein [Vicinamibacterales bacterium]
MTCRELTDFIVDYLEGGLAPEVQARFEHHLTVCPSCVRYLTAYRATIALGFAAFEDEDQSAEQAGVPEGFVRGVLGALNATRPSA